MMEAIIGKNVFDVCFHFSSLDHVYYQGAGFRNYSAPEGKQDIWVLFWGAVMSRIFIYSQWFNPENTVMKLNIAFHYSLR